MLQARAIEDSFPLHAHCLRSNCDRGQHRRCGRNPTCYDDQADYPRLCATELQENAITNRHLDHLLTPSGGRAIALAASAAAPSRPPGHARTTVQLHRAGAAHRTSAGDLPVSLPERINLSLPKNQKSGKIPEYHTRPGQPPKSHYSY